MSGSPPPAGFDFTALGWLQFEQLCSRLLVDSGVPSEAWVGGADWARWVVAEQGFDASALVGCAVDGPVAVRVVWMPRRVQSTATAWDRGREAMTGWPEGRVSSVVVMTNATANDEFERLVSEFLPRGARLWVVGRSELAGLVDARRDLWLEAPSVLGVRRADPVAGEALSSSLDIEAVRILAPTFVASSAYRRCCEAVERLGFAVLSGPPEVGKTAAARMLAYVQMCKGWEAYECTDPSQFWDAYRREREQVFISDDAFGSTEYRPDAAERWALDLDRMLKHTDERHWLIWTSRPTPLTAALRRIHREHGVERFPQPAKVMVDAADLGPDERALILYRHAVSADLATRDRRAIRRWGPMIVADPHFTPERIRRFVWERLPHITANPNYGGRIRDLIRIELAEPTHAMRTSLEALQPDHQALLTALLDAPPTPVAEREIAAAMRRHGGGLGRPVPVLVERLSDHFLRVVPPTSITWAHPSWRDLVIDQLAANAAARRAFLERSSVEGVLLALSTGGGATGERMLPLLKNDSDWDALLGHIRTVVNDTDETDHVRLLRQLADAHEATLNVSTVAELNAVARHVLELTPTQPIIAATLPLLEAWHALATFVPEPPQAPSFALLWVETVPTATLNLFNPDHITALETWTTLAAVVREYDPIALRAYDFPLAQAPTIARIFQADVAELQATLPATVLETLDKTIGTLATLFPIQARRLPPLTHTVSASPIAGYAPHDDPTSSSVYDRIGIVSRVLSDLEDQ